MRSMALSDSACSTSARTGLPPIRHCTTPTRPHPKCWRSSSPAPGLGEITRTSGTLKAFLPGWYYKGMAPISRNIWCAAVCSWIIPKLFGQKPIPTMWSGFNTNMAMAFGDALVMVKSVPEQSSSTANPYSFPELRAYNAAMARVRSRSSSKRGLGARTRRASPKLSIHQRRASVFSTVAVTVHQRRPQAPMR